MPSSADFITRAQQLAASTPYLVTPRPGGCEIGLDIADARWWGLASRQRLQRTFTHQIELDEKQGTMQVTDVARSLAWSAGADGQAMPRLTGETSTTKGRIFEVSFDKEIGWGDDGSFGEQVDYTFDSTEGRSLIKKVAEEQGWQEKLSSNQRTGLWVALGAVGLIVVLGVITLILVLTR